MERFFICEICEIWSDIFTFVINNPSNAQQGGETGKTALKESKAVTIPRVKIRENSYRTLRIEMTAYNSEK